MCDCSPQVSHYACPLGRSLPIQAHPLPACPSRLGSAVCAIRRVRLESQAGRVACKGKQRAYLPGEGAPLYATWPSPALTLSTSTCRFGDAGTMQGRRYPE